MSSKEGEIVEIGIDEAIAVLKSAEIRALEKPVPDFIAARPGEIYSDPEIFHLGKWKSLCRTDFCDDVATGYITRTSADEWRAHYLEGIHFGARYSDRRFSVIDSMTDG